MPLPATTPFVVTPRHWIKRIPPSQRSWDPAINPQTVLSKGFTAIPVPANACQSVHRIAHFSPNLSPSQCPPSPIPPTIPPHPPLARRRAEPAGHHPPLLRRSDRALCSRKDERCRSAHRSGGEMAISTQQFLHRGCEPKLLLPLSRQLVFPSGARGGRAGAWRLARHRSG